MTHRPEDRIRQHYEPRIDPARDSHDVLDWACASSQQARFEVLVSNVDLAGRSLLDVGCGLGDLWGFLKSHDVAVDYTGVDLLPRMVAEAQRRHPDGTFVTRDLFTDPAPTDLQRDVVFCSGMFNLNVGNNLDFVPGAIDRFFELARTHVVFNMLHWRATAEPERYFFYKPEWVTDLLADRPCEVRVLEDYLPNDFTVIATLKD
ncbi:MAG: class I SAM-dependent methyltransferase [Phycisphaerae bacterium]